MDLTEEMVTDLVREIHGSEEIVYGEQKLSFAGPWRRASIVRLVGESLGFADEACDALESISSIAQPPMDVAHGNRGHSEELLDR